MATHPPAAICERVCGCRNHKPIIRADPTFTPGMVDQGNMWQLSNVCKTTQGLQPRVKNHLGNLQRGPKMSDSQQSWEKLKHYPKKGSLTTSVTPPGRWVTMTTWLQDIHSNFVHLSIGYSQRAHYNTPQLDCHPTRTSHWGNLAGQPTQGWQNQSEVLNHKSNNSMHT